MSAVVKQLRDDEGTLVYPVTKASAVYMPNGVDTVVRELTDMGDYNTRIEFSGKGINKTLASGCTSFTEFNDGSIKEVVKDADGAIIKIKTTKFNDDGSIEIEVV